MAGLFGNVGHVDGSESGGQQRLMSITPSGVHDETSLIVSHGLGESSGSLLLDDVPPTDLAGNRGVQNLARVLGIGQLGNGNFFGQTGLSALPLDGRSVDGQVPKVGQELLSSVLTGDEFEQVGSVVDERGPSLSALENGVGQETDQEGDVGLCRQIRGSQFQLFCPTTVSQTLTPRIRNSTNARRVFLLATS
jgi:hypothetical protein